VTKLKGHFSHCNKAVKDDKSKKDISHTAINHEAKAGFPLN